MSRFPRLDSSVTLLTLALIIASPALVFPATPFQVETVDADGLTTGQFPSLLIDDEGRFHVAYVGNGNTLEYGRKAAGVWTFETIDSAAFVGQYSSLALDSHGDLHVSYEDFDNFNLKYASRRRGVWTVETVDASFVYNHTSLAVDADDNIHISYYDGDSSDLRYAFKSNGIWATEAVDTTGHVGSWSSLALDNHGTPHIAYLDITNYNLKHAVMHDGVWMSETVDSSAQVGAHTSIAVDAWGRPHITYFNEGSDDLMYAWKDGATWPLETVDGFSSVGTASSLVLSPLGEPRISYYYIADQDVKYAALIDGDWSIEVVDAIGVVGLQTSLALDAHGNPSIAYHDNTNGALKLASSSIQLTSPGNGDAWLRGGRGMVAWDGTGTVDILLSLDGGAEYTTAISSVSGGSVLIDVPGTATSSARVKVVRSTPYSSSTSETFAIVPNRVSPWWRESVDETGLVGFLPSLSLHGDAPHVAYHDVANLDLKYARRAAGEWSVETVDAGADVGAFSSLEMDDDGVAHISYYDDTNGDLKYATGTGGAWTLEVVDTTGVVGWFTSLALDANGVPHISYYDLSNMTLRYADRTGGAWSAETADASLGSGLYSSLVIDDAGRPHVSYRAAGDLNYAVKDGGFWTSEVVDVPGEVGLHTSLRLDASGNPHVSYYDETNGDLKYAARYQGTWAIEVVDAAGDVGAFSSLALNATGKPRIAYYDGTGLSLRYSVKTGTNWVIETIDATGDVGLGTSLALRSDMAPHAVYYDNTNGDLLYTTGAIAVSRPSGGMIWPVGSTRTVTWDGIGVVDILLSVDGGSSYMPIATNVSGGSHDLVVPHTPSRFSRVRVERRENANDFGTHVYQYSRSESDSLFTIETSIALLNMRVHRPENGSGLTISWDTDPGPPDLAGYRLDKRPAQGDYSTLVSRTRESVHHDAEGRDGDRYRLFAINGLGDEFHLGEASADLSPSFTGGLRAYPTPFRGRILTVEFATTTVNGSVVETEVAIYDPRGRKIRTLARGKFRPPFHRVTWDGTDGSGVRVPSGTYFLRESNGVTDHSRTLVIVR